MEETRKNLGERVRTIRKAKSLTQEELGEKAELSYKFIGEIERALVNPSLSTLTSIAKALDIDISQLFTEDWQLSPEYQLPPKDIQLIKDVLPSINQILKTFSDLNKTFNDWGTKELERIKKAIIPLNKLFLKK